MKFSAREPIYTQIVDVYKKKIASGDFPPGEAIPPRRELAKTFGVNPNTVQRAFKEMEDNGWITTLRGSGSVVTENSEIILALQRSMLDELSSQFVSEMRSLRASDEEILRMVKLKLEGGISSDCS
ncbi:GntR family transcriptional regulator [Bacillus sp. JJ722]|uniref:GntR family transcriptional regulator n=1 Tax=Bacillus sp. JJ722 TaxID=3122973 RepID=UPI002FFE4451